MRPRFKCAAWGEDPRSQRNDDALPCARDTAGWACLIEDELLQVGDFVHVDADAMAVLFCEMEGVRRRQDCKNLKRNLLSPALQGTASQIVRYALPGPSQHENSRCA